MVPRIAPLVAAMAGLVAWGGAVAQAGPVAAADTCASSYADRADPADRLAQAAADLRACTRRGALAPHVARRLLSAIGTLRDASDYDLRRAWGTTARWRARRVDRQLDRIMAVAVSPAAERSTGATN